MTTNHSIVRSGVFKQFLLWSTWALVLCAEGLDRWIEAIVVGEEGVLVSFFLGVLTGCWLYGVTWSILGGTPRMEQGEKRRFRQLWSQSLPLVVSIVQMLVLVKAADYGSFVVSAILAAILAGVGWIILYRQGSSSCLACGKGYSAKAYGIQGMMLLTVCIAITITIVMSRLQSFPEVIRTSMLFGCMGVGTWFALMWWILRRRPLPIFVSLVIVLVHFVSLLVIANWFFFLEPEQTAELAVGTVGVYFTAFLLLGTMRASDLTLVSAAS